MRTMLLLSILAVTLGGKITPKTSTPILPAYNNVNIHSDLTFTYQIETYMPANSVLKIHFPDYDYPVGLGMQNVCGAEDEFGNSFTCTVSDKTITVEVGETSNAPVDNTNIVIIKNVLNPSHTGATGLFKLETWLGVNLLDYNDHFWQIGIYPTFDDLTASGISCSTNCLPSQTGSYTVGFTTPVAIPSNARFYIRFPTVLTLQSHAPCSSAQITSLSCILLEDNWVQVTLGLQLSANFAGSITFSSITNPPYASNVGTFDIIFLQNSVNNILTRQLGISGPTLQPHSITSFSICPSNGVAACGDDTFANTFTGKTQSYSFTFSFTTVSALQNDSLIIVQVPASITPTADTCQVLSGLTNLQDNTTGMVRCTVNGQNLSLSKFMGQAAGTISVKFTGVVATSATTQQFTVTTYYDSSGIYSVDSGTLGGVSYSSYLEPSTFAFEQGTNSFIITYKPTTSLAVSNVITITFPQNFTLTGAFSCDHIDHASTTFNPSVTNTTSRKLQITLSTVTSNTASSTFTVSGATIANSSSNSPGTYPIYINFNDQDFEVGTWTVNALSPASFTVNHFVEDVNVKTYYQVTIDPGRTLNQGSVYSGTANIAKPYSKIIISFPTENTHSELLFKVDLGTGLSSGSSIPCQGGVLAANIQTGYNLACTITPASSVGNNVNIEIWNYAELTNGNNYIFQILNIENLQTGNLDTLGVTISMSVIYYIQGQQQPTYMQGSYSYSNSQKWYDDGTTALPVYNGHNPSAVYGGDDSNVLQFSDQEITNTGTITFLYWPEYDIASGDQIIIKFPTQLSFASANLGDNCKVNYISTLSCVKYPSSNWIIMTGYTFANHKEYTIQIPGITNPSDMQEIDQMWLIPYVSSREVEYAVYEKFRDIQGGIANASIVQGSNLANAVDVTYTVNLNFQHDLATDTYIVISFPENDFVLTTTPSLACGFEVGLIEASGGILCVFDSNTVTISNYAAYTAGTQIIMRIYHVLNPSEIVETTYFTVESFSSSDNVIDYNYQISGINFDRRAIVGTITHSKFYADPDNGGYEASLFIEFLPEYTISVNSVITVQLPPGEYQDLTGNQSCRMSGGLQLFQSCFASGSYIYIQTAEDYSEVYNPITIQIDNITNFAPGITSGLVSIQISYSGVVYQQSTENIANRSFTTSQMPNQVQTEFLVVSPKTQAELATYSFEVNLKSTVTTEDTVNIIFPDTIPRGLSFDIECESEKLGGIVDCEAENRTLTIHGSKTYVPDNIDDKERLSISVRYVYNPNNGFGLSDFIIFTQRDKTMIDYGKLDDSTQFNGYPAYMELTASSSTNIYTLFNSNISLTARWTGANFVSETDDRIIIQFPTDYDLDRVNSTVTCNSGILSETTTDPCTLQNNRVEINAFSTTVDTTLLTSFTVDVNGIKNPDEEGNKYYVEFLIFDAGTKQIVAKTLSNLNVVQSFSYEETESQIQINFGQDIKINQGTRSEEIFVILDDESAYNVEVQAAFPLGMTTVPSPIKVNIGEYITSFILSCDQRVQPAIYEIEWTASGDWEGEQFAPIQISNIIVSAGELNTIDISFDTPVIQGGHSLPIPVTLSSPPATQLIINVMQIGDEPSLMGIFPYQLVFGPEDTEKYIRLTVDKYSIGYNGQIYFYKEGEDADSYVFNKQDFMFQLGIKDTSVPQIRLLSAYHIERTSTVFRCYSSEPVDVYYAVALYGTETPTVSEFMRFKLDEQDEMKEQPKMGLAYKYNSNAISDYLYEWEVTGLTAQTQYTVFIYPIDPSDLSPGTLSKSFFTRDRNQTAVFRLKYLTNVLNESLLNSTITAIANILRIDSSLVAARRDFTYTTYRDISQQNNFAESDNPLFTTTAQRGLQTVGFQDFLMIPNVTSETAFSPLQYVSRLNEQRTALKAAVSLLDSTYQIQGYEIIAESPEFVSEPQLIFSGFNSAVIDDIQLSGAC